MTPLNTVCNRRSVLTLLIMGLLTTLVIFGSPEFQGRKSLLALQDGGAEAKGGDAQIEEIMDEMKSAGRSFRRALRGKKVEDALKHVQRAQLAVHTARVPMDLSALGKGKGGKGGNKGAAKGGTSLKDVTCYVCGKKAT